MDRTNTRVPYDKVYKAICDGLFIDYIFPIDKNDVLDFQQRLRDRIKDVFNVSTKPDYYDIGVLLFAYQTNPTILLTILDWDMFKDVFTTYLETNTILKENIIKPYRCICSKDISNLCYITDHNQIALLGNHCIEKNGGLMAEQLSIELSYECIGCTKRFSNESGYHTKRLCTICYKQGVKVYCLHCNRNKHCNSSQLCKSCSSTWYVCNKHPKIVLSILRHTKVTDCLLCNMELIREQDRISMEFCQQNKERQLMSLEDPINIKKEQERLRLIKESNQQIEERRLMSLEDKPTITPKESKRLLVKLPSDFQICFDCPTKLQISTIFIRCKPCYYKHINSSKPMITKCIDCKKLIPPTTYKTKCVQCFLKK